LAAVVFPFFMPIVPVTTVVVSMFAAKKEGHRPNQKYKAKEEGKSFEQSTKKPIPLV
jgi:hypothetical protein